MPKLNQIIAVEKGAKSRAQREIAEIGQRLQKTALLSGISRTYQPLDDDGESLPPESTRVQVTAEGTLKEVAAALTRLFDITATKDWANRDARADVVVDGRTVLEQVPVAHLLFLEKQLTELAGLVDRLPVLDTAEAWTFDESADVWRTEPVRTTRTKKIPRAHVLYEATTEHPRPGGDLHRGRHRRHLDPDRVLRRPAGAPGERAARARRQAAGRDQVRPRGGQRRGSDRPEGGRGRLRLPFRLNPPR
nr:hypothetical protein [Actinomadura violacea]